VLISLTRYSALDVVWALAALVAALQDLWLSHFNNQVC
jgi:hypothetical protein